MWNFHFFLNVAVFKWFSCMGSFLRPWVYSHFSPFCHSIWSQRKKRNIYYGYSNVKFYFLAAAQFMSHIRNAHSKHSNFLPQRFKHTWMFSLSTYLSWYTFCTLELISESANTHTVYFYTTKRNKWANRKQIKMSKKNWNKFCETIALQSCFTTFWSESMIYDAFAWFNNRFSVPVGSVKLIISKSKKAETATIMKIQTKCTHNSVGRNELN